MVDPVLNLPPVIGHRGAAAHAPENTLAGIRIAKSLGCSWVEFDVRLTGDGALVVCHDDRLERTTNGRGAISKLPLAEIREVDAGRRFDLRFAGERVPTFEEALAQCGELGLGANVEIKAEGSQGPAAAAAVATTLDGFAGGHPPVLVSSFIEDAVAEAARRMPKTPRAMLFRKVPRNWAEIAGALGCATVNADQRYLTERLVAEISAAGYPVLAYTVNDAARAVQVFSWGVTSVFSDAPDIILTEATPKIRDGARLGAIA